MSDTAPADLAGHGGPVSDQPEAALSGVRRRRSELKAAMTAFEEALDAGWEDPAAWLSPVAERFDALATAFRHHVSVHEGADSFHAEVLRVQPHLAARIQNLQRDHRRLEQALSELAGMVQPPAATRHAVTEVRGRATDVLHRLTSHRRRGADLVWEAFNADLGGEH